MNYKKFIFIAIFSQQSFASITAMIQPSSPYNRISIENENPTRTVSLRKIIHKSTGVGLLQDLQSKTDMCNTVAIINTMIDQNRKKYIGDESKKETTVAVTNVLLCLLMNVTYLHEQDSKKTSCSSKKQLSFNPETTIHNCFQYEIEATHPMTWTTLQDDTHNRKQMRYKKSVENDNQNSCCSCS